MTDELMKALNEINEYCSTDGFRINADGFAKDLKEMHEHFAELSVQEITRLNDIIKRAKIKLEETHDKEPNTPPARAYDILSEALNKKEG